MSKVPFPPFLDRPVSPRENDGANRTGGIRRTGNTFWHTMVGTLWSTDAWFRTAGSGALTPWGIGGALDGEYDGTIMRWLDYTNTAWQPWSSGPWIAPGEGDGPAYVTKFGVFGINGLAEAIETSGLIGTPVSEKQWLSLIWLTAAINHDAGRSAEEYLWRMYHREICIKSGKGCPWERITNYTAESTVAITDLMRYFEGDTKGVSQEHTIGGKKILLPFDSKPTKPTPQFGDYVGFPKPVTLHTGDWRAVIRQWAETGHGSILGYYDKKATDTFAGYYRGENVAGSDIWFVQNHDPRGRVHVSAFIDAERVLD